MERIRYRTAKKLFSDLSLNSELSNEGFIYRGQANAEWALIPSAFREDKSHLLRFTFLNSLGERTNREQVEAEFYTILDFIKELNLNGFHVPNEDILNLESCAMKYIEYDAKIGRGEYIWPAKEWHSVVALAQHFGIPTRFLDFTYDPYVAMYFAVKDVLENKEKYLNSEDIAIYAINSSSMKELSFTDNFGIQEYGFLDKSKENRRLYQIIKAPASFNQNLRNQRGMFLGFFEKNFKKNMKFEPFSVEEYLEEVKASKSYKLVIRKKHASELLELLHSRFYSASTMFPGIEGCVKSIYERNNFEQ